MQAITAHIGRDLEDIMLDSEKPLLSSATPPARADDTVGSGMFGSMFNLANSIIGAGVSVPLHG